MYELEICEGEERDRLLRLALNKFNIIYKKEYGEEIDFDRYKKEVAKNTLMVRLKGEDTFIGLDLDNNIPMWVKVCSLFSFKPGLGIKIFSIVSEKCENLGGYGIYGILHRSEHKFIKFLSRKGYVLSGNKWVIIAFKEFVNA